MKQLITLGLVLGSISFALGADLRQSPEALRAEKLQLTKWLEGRTLTCKNKAGEQRLVLSANGSELKVSTNYGDATDASSSQLNQLQTGELLVAYLSGPDSDEGGALVAINSGYLDRDGQVAAQAIVWGGIPGDEASNVSESLSCTLAK